jgi:hypothetical protein
MAILLTVVDMVVCPIINMCVRLCHRLREVEQSFITMISRVELMLK